MPCCFRRRQTSPIEQRSRPTQATAPQPMPPRASGPRGRVSKFVIPDVIFGIGTLVEVGGGRVQMVSDVVFAGADGGLALALDAVDADWEKLVT